VHLIAEFHHPTFNRSEVIVLTNKQTPLKASTSLRHATPVGNEACETVAARHSHISGEFFVFRQDSSQACEAVHISAYDFAESTYFSTLSPHTHR